MAILAMVVLLVSRVDSGRGHRMVTKEPDMPTRPTARSFPALLGLAVALTLLPAAPRAAAQGTSELLPDPVTSLDLIRYAERLSLSPDQRLAAETAHDEYKRQFKAFREGEIDEFLKSMQALQSGGMMPRREVVEAFLEKLDRLQSRIRLLDDSLFSALDAPLTDEQRLTLARLRLARERHRYRSNQFMSMGRPVTDLSEIIWEIRPPPEEMVEVDPIVAPYEQKLTSRMKDMHEAAGNMMRNVMTVYQDLGMEGMTEEQMSDPETMKKFMEAWRQRWAELTKSVNKATAEVSELNRRTARQIAGALPPERARAFRTRYHGRAYPELGIMLTIGDEPWLKLAEETGGLAEAQQAEVAGIIEIYRLDATKLTDEAIVLIEAQRANLSPFSMNQESVREHHEEMGRRSGRAAELAAGTQRALEAIVGAERLAAAANGQTQQQALAIAMGAGGGAAEVKVVEDAAAAEAAAKYAASADGWLPPPISPRDVASYAERLGLDETVRTILDQLHADYALEMSNLAAITELVKANQSLWHHDVASGQTTPPTAQAIDRTYDLRRQALEAIRALDDAFFEDLEALAPAGSEAAVARLSLGRERRSYRTMMGGPMFDMHQTMEDSVDLVDLTMGETLTDDRRQALEPMLDAYEAAMIPVLRSRFFARMGYQQVMERWGSAYQALASDTGAQMEMARRYQESMVAASRPVTEAGNALVELNRRTLATVLEALPDTDRSGFRRAYNRAAYPSVYNDVASVEEHLNRALRLEDLTDDQLASLTALAGSYWVEYEAMCQKMIALSAQGNPAMLGDTAQVDWAAWQQRQNEIQKLRFDRDEHSYRAIGRLEALLTPAQIERIGGLPKPEAKPHP